MRPDFTVRDWSDLPRAIAACDLAGAGHKIPLLRALYEGRIAYLELPRIGGAKLFKRWAAGITLPGVCVLGDDAYQAEAGPDHWAVARRVLSWARHVVAHGSGGEVRHYESAIALATLTGRVAFIECASADLDAWLAAAKRWSTSSSVTVIQNRDGVHPVPLRAEEAH